MATDSVGADEGMDERVLRALAHDRRQHVLAALENAGTALSLADLARSVARRESPARNGVEDETVKRVRLSLYHWHVPKLADVGLVDYDPDERTVRLATDSRLPRTLR